MQQCVSSTICRQRLLSLLFRSDRFVLKLLFTGGRGLSCIIFLFRVLCLSETISTGYTNVIDKQSGGGKGRLKNDSVRNASFLRWDVNRNHFDSCMCWLYMLIWVRYLTAFWATSSLNSHLQSATSTSHHTLASGLKVKLSSRWLEKKYDSPLHAIFSSSAVCKFYDPGRLAE